MNEMNINGCLIKYEILTAENSDRLGRELLEHLHYKSIIRIRSVEMCDGYLGALKEFCNTCSEYPIIMKAGECLQAADSIRLCLDLTMAKKAGFLSLEFLMEEDDGVMMYYAMGEGKNFRVAADAYFIGFSLSGVLSDKNTRGILARELNGWKGISEDLSSFLEDLKMNQSDVKSMKTF